MKETKYIVEIKLDKYLKENNKLYKVEIFLYDFEKNKKVLFNDNLAIRESKKLKCECFLKENKEYKITIRILLEGKIEKVEQIIFNTQTEYLSEKVNILKEENYKGQDIEMPIPKTKQIAQNPTINWREEGERISIYNNGKLMFLNGMLKIIWENCNKLTTIYNLNKKLEEYPLEYINMAVNILIEKGVLVEYEQ